MSKHLTRLGGHLMKVAGHLTRILTGSGDPCVCCSNECAPCTGCAIDPDPHCCDPCPTPGQIRVLILAAEASLNCSYDTASPFHVHLLDVSGLPGRTFTLLPDPDNPCCWVAVVDTTAWFKILQCDGDGTGCAACTPTLDITVWSSMTIRYCVVGDSGTLRFDFTIEGSDPVQDEGVLLCGGSDFTNPGPPCCPSWTATAPGVGSGAIMEAVAVTHVTVTAC